MNPGIETKIDGITYRSLLEAKWAVFLAALEIPVLYEPFELAGYIPDFIIPKSRLVIEVKPALTVQDCTPALAKIKASG